MLKTVGVKEGDCCYKSFDSSGGIGDDMKYRERFANLCKDQRA